MLFLQVYLHIIINDSNNNVQHQFRLENLSVRFCSFAFVRKGWYASIHQFRITIIFMYCTSATQLCYIGILLILREKILIMRGALDMIMTSNIAPSVILRTSSSVFLQYPCP